MVFFSFSFLKSTRRCRDLQRKVLSLVTFGRTQKEPAAADYMECVFWLVRQWREKTLLEATIIRRRECLCCGHLRKEEALLQQLLHRLTLCRLSVRAACQTGVEKSHVFSLLHQLELASHILSIETVNQRLLQSFDCYKLTSWLQVFTCTVEFVKVMVVTARKSSSFEI